MEFFDDEFRKFCFQFESSPFKYYLTEMYAAVYGNARGGMARNASFGVPCSRLSPD